MWQLLRGIAILGWLFGLIGGLVLDYQFARWILLIMVVVHPLEIPFITPLARRRGVPMGKAALGTLLFGFTYWVPELLRR